MCNYRCPRAERKKCAGFLLCRLLYKEGVDYGIRENAMGVICAHQKQCMATGLMENTDEAKRCAISAPADDVFFIGENAPDGASASDGETKITTAVSGKKKN